MYLVVYQYEIYFSIANHINFAYCGLNLYLDVSRETFIFVFLYIDNIFYQQQNVDKVEKVSRETLLSKFYI